MGVMNNKQIKSLNEAIAGVVSPQPEQLDEKKLSPEKQAKLNDLINRIYSASDPSGYSEEREEELIAVVKKEFGNKIASDLEDGIYTMHFGRGHSQASFLDDPMLDRKHNKITKKGKLNKTDANVLKAKIRKHLGIKEETVPLDEAISNVMNEVTKPNVSPIVAYIETSGGSMFKDKWKKVQAKNVKDLEKQVTAALDKDIKKEHGTATFSTLGSIDKFLKNGGVPFCYIDPSTLEISRQVSIDFASNKKTARKQWDDANMSI